MLRPSLWFLGMVATGCSFQARSAQHAPDVDGATGGEMPIIAKDAGLDARASDAPLDAKVFLDAPPVSGSLSVSSASVANGDTNLTTEGTVDWAHWGHASAADFDHKIGANMISDITVTSGASRLQIANITATASWSDGTPDQTVSATGTGVGAYAGTGLSFTVPAGTTPQTLRVYLGDKASTERLDVSLSDNSAAAFTTMQTAGLSALHTVFTITYNAARPGQTLTVTWTDVNDSGGFAMLMSATLE